MHKPTLIVSVLAVMSGAIIAAPAKAQDFLEPLPDIGGEESVTVEAHGTTDPAVSEDAVILDSAQENAADLTIKGIQEISREENTHGPREKSGAFGKPERQTTKYYRPQIVQPPEAALTEKTSEESPEDIPAEPAGNDPEKNTGEVTEPDPQPEKGLPGF